MKQVVLAGNLHGILYFREGFVLPVHYSTFCTMRSFILACLLLSLLFSCNSNTTSSQEPVGSFEWAIVIHGGAGFATPEGLGAEGIRAYEQAMDSALTIGSEILSGHGASMDAVEQVIRYLEDNPLFNAGRGSALTSDGRVEMDASVMRGSDLNAGAVAGVTDVRHPISAARAVMEQSKHVMLSGPGASRFAKSAGLEIIDQDYFQTEKSKESLKRAVEKEGTGTVGCVALDHQGNLAAGTSTGGITNKKHGRIGDAPIIGAGTYAKNGVAGISCTGQGEFYIRLAIAHEVIALMQYKAYTVEEAAQEVIFTRLKQFEALGGIICLDAAGHCAMEYNTAAMFRAYGNSEGDQIIKIFKD
jgi:beta-aspartyl-peptidase (threonine type)